MTEEEAKTKLCPHRVGVIEYRIENLGDFSDGPQKYQIDPFCIASDCMMWREHEVKSGGGRGTKIRTYQEEGGYCGLGGKP